MADALVSVQKLPLLAWTLKHDHQSLLLSIVARCRSSIKRPAQSGRHSSPWQSSSMWTLLMRHWLRKQTLLHMEQAAVPGVPGGHGR